MGLANQRRKTCEFQELLRRHPWHPDRTEILQNPLRRCRSPMAMDFQLVWPDRGNHHRFADETWIFSGSPVAVANRADAEVSWCRRLEAPQHAGLGTVSPDRDHRDGAAAGAGQHRSNAAGSAGLERSLWDWYSHFSVEPSNW